MNNKLNLNKASVTTFDKIESIKSRVNNVFIITHLGQLNQMEALIRSKNLSKNLLVVLFTTKNLIVPQTVHDRYSSLYEAVIFLEIPFGANIHNYFIYKKLEKDYLKLITLTLPLNLYLNSFESHYSLLASIAKSFGIKVVLVEEGTATYKINNDYIRKSSLDSFQSVFMETIGKSQQFKKIVRYKKDFKKIDHTFFSFFVSDFIFDRRFEKNNKELYSEARRFFKKLLRNEDINKKFINAIGSRYLRSSLVPFREFDKAFVSHPDMTKKDFQIKDVEFFFAHSLHNFQESKYARDIANKYGIQNGDALFVSQRYFLDSLQYINVINETVVPLIGNKQRLFIKLHPKETGLVFEAFKVLEADSKGQIILIDDKLFLIEALIKLVKFERVIGITSTTLVYTPLISSKTQVISIADSLIRFFEENKSIDSKNSILNIKNHLKILRRFQNIEFI